MSKFLLPCLLTLSLLACQPDKQFKLLGPGDSGITFGNALTIADTMNILDNELVYNGAGVTIADWNGDSLPDLFFTANMADNALYINKGDLKFEDITKQAGVSKPRQCWSAGSTVVDINADGKLDLYVSNMMYGQAELRRNLLYVNQGNDAAGMPKFVEMSHDYGLDNDSHSAQTVFFDYDNDGDLDAYIVVNVMDMQFANQYMSKAMQANSPTADRLLRNDFDPKQGHAVFMDVSKQAGIEAQGYGHGVSVMDINQDGWLDLYVTNDYLSNDNLFINNGEGRRVNGEGRNPSPFFTDRAHDCLKHQSWSAMGNDVADINNDGLLDLIAMDMLPDYNERKKALLRANSYAHYQFTEQYGYEYQHIRNTLQLNRGLDPKTHLPQFSDISQLAGVNETDWSWCPLWLDADNDGHRDLLITNGFPKDITDQDFLAYRNDGASILVTKAELYRVIPEVKIPNYVYRNQGNLTFADKTKEWGLDAPTFSNGAAYADLDNDGDLDLVINNTNDYAHVYQNTQNDHRNTGDSTANYLRIRLAGPALNPMGIGAKVTVWAGGQQHYAEQSVVHGYLSTSEPVLHIGLGKIHKIDSVRVVWPACLGKPACRQTLRSLVVNRVLTVSYTAHLSENNPDTTPTTLLTELNPASLGITYTHAEQDYIDFNIQKTLPHKFSAMGPGVTVGDVNGDGLDDFYVGGSSRLEGQFFMQQRGSNGTATFRQQEQSLKMAPGKREEDTGVLFFDADGDKDLDLYCTRGSYQHAANSPALQDALFRNDGLGNFRRDSLALPRETANGRVVRAADYDHDGDLDLFVGGSVVPAQYPKADKSFVLRNDKGRFTNVTAQIAPDLANLGPISDALWTDYDNDGWPDLLLAGEWMPLTLLKSERATVRRIGERKTDGPTYRRAKDTKLFSPTFTLSPIRSFALSSGWWTSLCAGDFDRDGDTDYIAGNYGMNTAFHASTTEPLRVYADDFDKNGTYDAILAHYDNNANGKRQLYPYHTRDDLIKQSILFRRRFLKYADFGGATMNEILTPAETKGALVKEANYLQSAYLENLGNGQFSLSPLPVQAQFAPIFGMFCYDINADGWPDLLLIGNDHGMETFQGQADASYGLVLMNRPGKQTGSNRFRAVDMTQSGFVVPGEGRAMAHLTLANGTDCLLATQCRGPLRLFQKTKQPTSPKP